MVPKRWTHLRDMMPVARHAESTGRVTCWWLAFKASDLATLRRDGHAAVLADCFAPTAIDDSLRLRLDLAMEGLDRTSGRPDAAEPTEWSVTLDAMLGELASMLTPLRITAHALTRAFEQVAPDLVMLGSPRMHEGTLAIAGARA